MRPDGFVCQICIQVASFCLDHRRGRPMTKGCFTTPGGIPLRHYVPQYAGDPKISLSLFMGKDSASFTIAKLRLAGLSRETCGFYAFRVSCKDSREPRSYMASTGFWAPLSKACSHFYHACFAVGHLRLFARVKGFKKLLKEFSVLGGCKTQSFLRRVPHSFHAVAPI